MEDKDIFEELLKLAKERANSPLPLGFVVETVNACISETYNRIPEEATKEQTVNFIINTLLVSLVATFVCCGNEKEAKEKVKNLINKLEKNNTEKKN